MLGVKRSSHGARPKRASRIERTARVIDADHLGYEEREPDADGRDERRLVLLLCEHEDGEDEFGGQQGFDEDALHEAGAAGKRGSHVKVSWEEA